MPTYHMYVRSILWVCGISTCGYVSAVRPAHFNHGMYHIVPVLPPTRDRTEIDTPFLEIQAFRRDGQDTTSGRHLFES